MNKYIVKLINNTDETIEANSFDVTKEEGNLVFYNEDGSVHGVIIGGIWVSIFPHNQKEEAQKQNVLTLIKDN